MTKTYEVEIVGKVLIVSANGDRIAVGSPKVCAEALKEHWQALLKADA